MKIFSISATYTLNNNFFQNVNENIFTEDMEIDNHQDISEANTDESSQD